MKKLLILLLTLIFIICDKKYNEKLDEKFRNKTSKKNENKRSNYFRKHRLCANSCPRGQYEGDSCYCKCRFGYDSKGNCKKSYGNHNFTNRTRCSKGYFYSRYYAKCCPLKGRTCRPITNKKQKELIIRFFFSF